LEAVTLDVIVAAGKGSDGDLVMGFANALRNHELLRGTLLTTSSCEIAEAISHTGLDWAFIELEHAALDISDAQNIVRALGGRIGSLIRIADQSVTSIKKALDTGCDGIIVPQVNTREEAMAIVRAAQYAPQGERSVGLARAHKYGLDFKGYIDFANEVTCVIAQVENIKAVENLDAIISVPGIDAFFIGPYDLSASMGLTGQLDHPAVKEAIAKVFTKASKAKMPVGIFAGTLDAGMASLEKGATLLAISTDILLLARGAQEIAGIRRILQ
jgi:2-keto-3-deoxy-L-rhamnonate aldolase RhmA